MTAIRELRARARRCRDTAFATPIVSSLDEAEALVRAITDQLATASPDEALLCLASLNEIQAALDARVARLHAEMAEARRQLDASRQGVQACVSYGLAASLSRRAH